MNKQLSRILEIAKKDSRLIIGLMSGTSLDGLDIALCKCSQNKVEIVEFRSVQYDQKLRSSLSEVQSKENADLSKVCFLNSQIAHYYSQCITDSLKEWGISKDNIDLIASHGQTIYHLPDEELSATLQIVDGDHIAQKTGIITISDFRQKHTSVGGQGAPLAALMDEKLFRAENKNRMLLNLGGIANFTWLPSVKSGLDVITSDTGPANTLINEAMQKYFDQPYDKDGKTAAEGNTNRQLLKYLLLEPYFRKPFPKTTGQEIFNLKVVEELMMSHRIELNPEDLVATLTSLTVQSITRAFDKIAGEKSYELYISGGGVHNKTMISSLKERLPDIQIKAFKELGIHPDAKEAALMAFLANDLVSGDGFSVNGETVHLGKISLPD